MKQLEKYEVDAMTLLEKLPRDTVIILANVRERRLQTVLRGDSMKTVIAEAGDLMQYIDPDEMK
jgi:hypothetical protein